MSFTADLDKFSALISLLDLKDSSNQDNQNGIAYHSLNEQVMAKLQGSIYNSRNESRKLVGNPLGLTSGLSSTGSNSSLASPPYAPTSSVLSCLGLQSSDTMLQMCPEESGRLMDEDQQQQQELMNGHRRLDRSASEPYNRGLASSAYSVTRSASNNTNSSSSSSNSSSGGSGSSYCRYKTELCRPFDENGSCKYGDKCQFAHGRHELRSLARHPKYKTDLCKTYHTTGLCPYGPRCHFIHNDEERQLNLVNRLVLEHKKTQAMYEQHRTQLAHQQQVIAAAVAAQKLLQQQQQQHPTLTKQMSVDAALMAAQQLQQQQSQLQHQTSALFNYRGSVDSSSDSQSSSITESPSPSPTSLMFEDPASTLTKHNSAAYRMTGTNAWSSLDETTHVSGSSDALQTILESILKNKSTGSRLSFRDCIGEAENNYSSFQSVGYLH